MNKKSLLLSIVLLVFFLNSKFIFGQCVVCVDAPTLITCGETATLTGDGYLSSIYSDNFNSPWNQSNLWADITLGGGATSTCTGSATTTVSCAGTGVVPAGNHLWFNVGSATPRQASTVPIPVPLGGNVIFEFKMEAQSAAGCDGPDLLNEGIMLQYSTNGITWVDMPATSWPFNLNPMPYTNVAYFGPTNPALQSFTTWAQYSVPIPVAAWGPNTSFRWSQTSTSGPTFDLWGLENVNIQTTPPGGTTYTWENLSTGLITASQTLTVNPTVSTNYEFTYTNGGVSCSTTAAINVAPPVVTPSITSSANPCPNILDLSADVSFNTCNYSIYLYDQGGDGWATIPQTPTSIDNRLEVFIDGVSQGTFTMSPPGAGADPYGPNSDQYGPVIYTFPVTAGGTFQVDFLSGGPNPNECAYFVTDNQGNLITNATGNIISSMGITGQPNYPAIPFPPALGYAASPAFNVTPISFGPVASVCPTTNSYNYSWLTSPGGLTTGITSPLNSTTTVSVYPGPQDYEVCITDQSNPGCVGCSTITVPGNPSITTFDFSITSNNPLCSNGSNILNFLITETSGTLTPGSGNYSFDIVDGSGTIINPVPITCTGFPYAGFITIPLISGSYDFDILTITNTGNLCQIYPTTTPSLQTLVINDPPNAGFVITDPINLCQNEGPNFYLPNAIGGPPDFNGVWSDAGGGNPDPTLPFNSFNYSLDPAILPVGNYLYQYTVPPLPGCPSPAFVQTTVIIDAAPTAGSLPTSFSICSYNLPLDLNTLFNTLPVPFSGISWENITSSGSATPIGSGIPILNPNTWNASAGTYLLRCIANPSASCPNQDIEEITIIISNPPTSTLSTSDPNNQVCTNDLVNLDFGIIGGIGNYNISYLDPNNTLQNVTVDQNSNLVSSGTPVIISTLSAGTLTYTIAQIEEISTGCIDATPSSVTLTVFQSPYAGITTANTICEDDFTLYDLNNDPAFFPTGGDAGGIWSFGGNPIIGTFRAADNFGNSVDPFGIYTYTVNDPSGTCPNDFTNITITAESPPNTGNPVIPIKDICDNNIFITNYDLNQLINGEDPGGIWTYNGLAVSNPIDLSGYSSLPTTHTFQYELNPPIGSSCSNNGSLPYTTISDLIINPEPQIDLASVTSNPNPVSQGLSTSISVGMLSGTPPFTVYLHGDENPMGTYATFSITSGMNGSGSVTPNYDPGADPVTVFIDSIRDINDCVTYPSSTTNVTVIPFPLATVVSSATSICRENTNPLNLIATASQGTPPISITFTIDGGGSNCPGTIPPAASTLSFSSGDVLCDGTIIPYINALNTPFLFDISSELNIGMNTIVFTKIEANGGSISPSDTLPEPIIIEVFSTPVIDAFSPLKTPICENEDAVIQFNFNSGVGQEPFNIDYIYTGSANTSFSTSTINHQEILSLTANAIDYTFTITSFSDANGCIGLIPSPFNLQVNETPIISLNNFMPSEICEGNTIPLNLQTPISLSPLAAPPYTITINGMSPNYVLNNNGTQTSGLNAGSLIEYTPISAGVYPYIITAFTDNNGCGLIDTINNMVELIVNETADMIITSTADTGEICMGEEAFINFEFTNGTAPWTVNFLKNGSLITTPAYNNSITIPQTIFTNSTTFDFVSVNDIKGCIKTPILTGTPFDIIANNLPIAELTVDGSRFICNDGSLTNIEFNFLDGIPNYKVNYSVNGDNRYLEFLTPNPPTIPTNEHGEWKITQIVDGNNCKGKDLGDDVFIQVNPIPQPNFMVYPQPAYTDNPIINFVNQSEGYMYSEWIFNNPINDTITSPIDNFAWKFDAQADTHFVTLQVVSDSGCTAEITQPIIISDKFSYFIPDAFTPNNDLYNDHFMPVVRSIKEYKLSVYDRSGNRVFETDKYLDAALLSEQDYNSKYNDCMVSGCDEAWDGTINNSGEYGVAGTYVYSIEIIDQGGKKRSYQGIINLIR
ncbi:MAG: hypothetical protein CMD03_05950 [Flavobacteriales bacterium]|nr:hypothetical protein [Flavobacteriales bacterium]